MRRKALTIENPHCDILNSESLPSQQHAPNVGCSDLFTLVGVKSRRSLLLKKECAPSFDMPYSSPNVRTITQYRAANRIKVFTVVRNFGYFS